ncbi:MAG: hypothetical protein JWN86_3268 [Planctomycetota bacterium]|nr:hypothetical protein [Planctomycetota bacterium]
MPVHAWSRVDPGIFHDFHQIWVIEIRRALNSGLLPASYYAMAEQHGGGYEPDVVTLKARTPEPMVYGANGGSGERATPQGEAGGVLLAEPKARVRVETDLEFYRRKQNVVAVRHASGDELVAVVEIVSRGNKSGRAAFDLFVKKAVEYLAYGIHLLILDLQPPTSRDPQGIHGAIWDAVAGGEYAAPADKPLTLAAYEGALGVRAFVEPIAVGDPLSPMPLFLRPGGHILVPLEETYQAAWESVPRRWRDVIAPPS